MVMPETPEWLQEIRERADKATEGPWMLTSSILGDSLVVLANDEETGVLFPSKVVAHIPGGKRAVDTGLFIEAAIQDVPRLLGLVEEMARVLELVKITGCRPLTELSVDWALQRYRGEVENDG